MGIVDAPRHLTDSSLPYISELVKSERVELGLSQVDFAKAIGIGLKTLRKVEQGDLSVNFKTLIYILNCLGQSLVPSEIVTSPIQRRPVALSTEKVIEQLECIFPILSRKYGVSFMALFGSYAKQESNPESDIDVLLEFEAESCFETEGEIILLLENLFKGTKVDLTLRKNLIKEFRDEIEETKIVIEKKL